MCKTPAIGSPAHFSRMKGKVLLQLLSNSVTGVTSRAPFAAVMKPVVVSLSNNSRSQSFPFILEKPLLEGVSKLSFFQVEQKDPVLLLAALNSHQKFQPSSDRTPPVVRSSSHCSA